MMQNSADRKPGSRKAWRLTIPLLAVALVLSACQSPKLVDRLGPPWNSVKMRDKAAEFAEIDAPAPLPLPREDKVLTYEDCLAVAAQHAPDMVEGAIALEVAEIETETAYWKRVPNIQAIFRVTANLTRNYEEYEDTSYRFALGIYGFEPVVSYFSSQAAILMENIAVDTYQIALEKRAKQIGESMLRLEQLKKMRELNTQLLGLAQLSLRHQRAVEGADRDELGHARSRQLLAQARAELEKTESAIAAELLDLKIMMGFDLDRKLQVTGTDLGDLLQKDVASGVFAKSAWEEVWRLSPEARIARTSHKLADYGVRTAWARYLPTATFDIYTANPYSDYASYSSDDEVFFTMQFSMPLWDWGERYRGVEQRRLKKVQASQRVKLSRLKFVGAWNTAWQDQRLAQAKLDVARHKAAAARLEEQKLSLLYDARQTEFSAVVEAGERRIEAEVQEQEAALDLRLMELANWFTSGGFRDRFFMRDARGEDKQTS